MNVLDVRLAIGRVYSLRRLVALDTPEFWSNLRVNLDVHHRTVLDDWLGRSDFLNSFHPGSMDLLETLRIDGRFESITAASITVLRGPPRLRSVTFCSFASHCGEVPFNLKVLGIPWQQLAEICLEDVAFAMIALPDLRKLGLAGSSSLRNYAKFLDSFTLPSLLELNLRRPREVDIDFDDIHEDDTMYAIAAFPAVQRLTLDVAYYLDLLHPQLVPWFRACPTAVELWLHLYTMPDYVLNQIAQTAPVRLGLRP
ncbi:hypothetical protein FB451DRAFT_1174473 [Mycena latifolia]|nr:hypothetical protein FB451DRAFT_1174473 [Mycena latifolia]